MKTGFQGLTVLAVAGVLALVCAPQANATVEITLTNGASSITVVDGSAQDSCAAANCVTYNGSIGNYVISVSTGLSNNAGVNPFLDLNSVNMVFPPSLGGPSGPAGVLTIATSNTGFTTQATQFSFSVGGTSSLGGGTSFAAYGGNSNTIFDTSHQIGSTLSFPSTPFSGATIGTGNTMSTYSLTLVASINGLNSGAASFDAAIDAVPEPVSVSLLGGVLLFTASAIRRKLRRTA